MAKVKIKIDDPMTQALNRLALAIEESNRIAQQQPYYYSTAPAECPDIPKWVPPYEIT